MIACDCGVCRSTDPRNHRGRTSVHVTMDGLHFQVDAAPEFRLQCLRNDIRQLDYFILTHGHADHIAGMDDLRRFCDLRGATALPVYSTSEGLARVLAMYPYAITDKPLARGYPAFALMELPTEVSWPQGVLRSTLLPHGGVNSLGLHFQENSTGKRFAYYTDCKRVPREAVELARGADLLVLDGLRPDPHPSHLSIAEAVQVAQEIGARQTLLIHLTHISDHAETEAGLPPGIKLAYDSLRVTV